MLFAHLISCEFFTYAIYYPNTIIINLVNKNLKHKNSSCEELLQLYAMCLT